MHASTESYALLNCLVIFAFIVTVDFEVDFGFAVILLS